MIDLLVVVALSLFGWLLTPPLRATVRAAASLPIGAAAFVSTAVVVAVVAPTLGPWTALGVTGALAVAAGARRPLLRPGDGRVLALSLAIAAAATAVSHAVPLVNVTVDSFRYITVGGLYASGQLLDVGSLSLVLKRGLAMGALHSMGPTELGYLRVLGPLVGVSTLVLLWTSLRDHLSPHGGRLARIAAAAAVLLLATNHRWVFSALYLNSHGLVALWVLLLALLCWWTARGELPATATTAGTAAVLAVALTAARPEGAVVAALAVAPVALDGTVPLAWRRAVLASVGVASVVWHAGVLGARLIVPRDLGWTIEVGGLALMGAVVVVVALLLPVVDRLVAATPGGRVGAVLGINAGLWLVVVALGLRNPSTLLSAVEATLTNVLSEGLWGMSLVVLAFLALQGALAFSIDRGDVLLHPVASFLPLGLVLALIRGGAGYRVGAGDSFNRMLVHVVPLAVLYVGALVAGRSRPQVATVLSRSDDAGGSRVDRQRGLGRNRVGPR